MDDEVGPEDAARALIEIGQRREQVIRRVAIPNWYWWALSILTIAITAADESRHWLILWIAIAVFVASTLAATGRQLFLALAAPPRRDLARPVSGITILVGITTFAAVVVGVTLAVGLTLKAAKVPYPGTISAAAAAVPLVIGGPVLTRYTGGFTRGLRSESRG
jgi:hypothetical protein